MKLMTDLCWQCQKNSTGILRTSNNDDAVKSKAYADVLEYLRIVKLEHSLYESVCDQCRDDVLSYFTVGSVFRPSPLSPLNILRIHNLFLFIIHLIMPSRFTSHRIHCTGPIYFPTARNCSLFSVHCEALPQLVNILTDEAGDCGKGANSVASNCTTSLPTMGWERRKFFCTATTALAKIRTVV